MLLVIPYRSDAFARGFPWGTVGLVAANLLVAALLGFPGDGPAFVDRLVLRFGRLDPFTWLSSAFVHLGWIHLLANMVFLWAFGFIAEALLGLRRFLLAYLVLATASGAVCQLLLLGAEGAAAGASGAIMGLMMTAGLWAPRTNLSVLVWFLPIVRLTEIQVVRFCAYYLLVEVLLALLQGFRLTRELLHLLGAGCGLATGLVTLKKGWVDTEGRDYLALRRGRPSPRDAPKGASRAVDPRVEALVAVRDALDAGEAWRAESAYASGQGAAPAFLLPREDLGRLIDALRAQGHRNAAIARMEEYLRADPEAPAAVRLALAEDLLETKRRGRARDHLDALAGRALAPGDEERRRALEERCRAAPAEGGLELE